MFARSSSTHVAPEALDALLSYVRERGLPQLQTAHGFKHFLDMVDRQSGYSNAISFWESEAAMSAAEEVGNKVRTEAVSAVHADPPKVERYEALIEEHSPAPPASGTAAVRIMRRHSEPGEIDQAFQYLRERLLPQVLARNGLRSYYAMVERQTGKALALGIYDSASDRKAAEPAADASNAQAVREQHFGPLDITSCAVAIRV